MNNDSSRESQEKPEQKTAWRKQILRKIMQGRKRPLIQETGWELLYNNRTKEYSFMVGNTILFVDENGNPVSVNVLEHGRVRPSTQIVKMTILMDHALNHYARKHHAEFSGEEPEGDEGIDEIPTGLTVDVKPENPPEESAPGVIKKIRRRLNL